MLPGSIFLYLQISVRYQFNFVIFYCLPNFRIAYQCSIVHSLEGIRGFLQQILVNEAAMTAEEEYYVIGY